MTRLFAALAVAVFVHAAGAQTDPYTVEGGGLKDPATGLVWGETIRSSSGSYAHWQWAYDYAQGWSVTTANPDGTTTTYDDWRLPSVAELQGLIANNPDILEALVAMPDGRPRYDFTVGFWTGDARGGYAYTVELLFVEVFDEGGNFLYFYLDQERSGQANWTKKDSYATDAFTVRNPNAPAGGGRGGGKK